MSTTMACPECGTQREDWTRVCDACGAPPSAQPRADSPLEGVRAADIEPYVALRYIARLFKVLAVLIVIMIVSEVALGLAIDGRTALALLLGEATRLLVLACMLWAAADIAVLMIDAGHDLRVARILLGRINARLHSPPASGGPDVRPLAPDAVALKPGASSSELP